MHLASGGPKQHHAGCTPCIWLVEVLNNIMQDVHHATLTRKELVDNIKIVRTERDAYRLSILESLPIKKVKHKLYNQMTGTHRKLFFST